MSSNIAKMRFTETSPQPLVVSLSIFDLVQDTLGHDSVAPTLEKWRKESQFKTMRFEWKVYSLFSQSLPGKR